MAKKLSLIKDLTQLGDVLGRSLRTNLRWSTKLRNAVKVGKAVESGEVTSIEVTVGEGDKNLTGMARAFESGSGLHGKFLKRYKIQGRPYLAFFGTNGYGNTYGAQNPNTRKGVGSKNIVVVKEVMHPGVKPKPFVSKSLQAILPRMAADIRVSVARQLKENIIVTLREIK